MNTNHDDTKLILWLDDELEGEEFAAMEESCAGNTELLAKREEHRAWKQWISQGVPPAQEPPYDDFFNARILRAIKHEGQEQADIVRSSGGLSWRSWYMPAAAAAGMVIAFQLGVRTQTAPHVVDIDVSNAPRAIPVEPILYTPEKGVKARWFKSPQADAFVIVLDGIPAIPDAIDFSKSLSHTEEEETDRAMVDLLLPMQPQTGGGS
jgi:hypothetical protein